MSTSRLVEDAAAFIHHTSLAELATAVAVFYHSRLILAPMEDILVAASADRSAHISELLRHHANDGSVELMRALAQELAEDALRPHSLITLSYKVAGGGTLLTQLIDSLIDHMCTHDGAPASVAREKRDAASMLASHRTYLLKLVRAADVSLLSDRGESALSLLCRRSHPDCTSSWSYEMAQALLEAGAAVDARDRDGWTPLHQWTLTASESACGPLLLLRHGADIFAKTRFGSSLLHELVRSVRQQQHRMLPALHELAASGYLAVANYSQLDHAGQTALRAARGLVAERPDDTAALELLNTLQAQSSMWRERIRPAALNLLSDASLPLDLAEIVLGYVDGTQRPSEIQDAAALKQRLSQQPGASADSPLRGDGVLCA